MSWEREPERVGVSWEREPERGGVSWEREPERGGVSWERGGGRVAALVLVVLAALAVPGAAQARGRCGIHPWCNTALSPTARANLVVAAMTTNEKIAFLGGDDFEGGVGSGPDIHTGIQDGVPRIGVPTVYYTDGPLGPRQGPSTGMPAPLGLAATFDPALAHLYGSVVGNEAKDKGNDVVFAPTVNVMRTPIGGRTYEAFGEDPFLIARTAVAWIDGLQAQGVLADIKHFAANNQEGEDPRRTQAGPSSPPPQWGLLGIRYLDNSIIDDRTLHEIYLSQFETAVHEAHPATVMCSYNKLDGTYACENGHLLRTILRGQWGFKGYVLADYGAAHNTIASLNNGLDFEPWPPFAYRPFEIQAALAARQASEQTLDSHVRAILATWFRYGV